MATPAQWARGYARQAHADFRTWQALESNEDAQACHRMLFLQMACEKLCKARLIVGGAPPGALQSSHGYVASPLPLVIRSQLEFMGENLKARAGVIGFARHLAAEIEVMNPAVDRDGQRPDNCEYPWEDSARILHSPLEWPFTHERVIIRVAHRPTHVSSQSLSNAKVLQSLALE